MVSFSRGKLNNDTQRVTAWQNEAVEYTSAFVTNIHNKIANEITKVEFNHVKYKKDEAGSDPLISKAGSDLDEVLNWSPKGEHNSMEFWQKVIKKLLCTRYVDLYPIFDRETGDLADLLLTNDGKEYKPEELVRLFSPFYINEDTSILDNALASIQTKLEQGKLRGLLKINAFLDIDNTQEYREKALTTIKNMQEGSSYNGLTPVDNKTEIVELKKDYSVLNKDEIDLIKSELLTGYFMNENILLGTATQEQQIYFYNSTIIPLLIQLEKELTYKLISTGRRRINKDNLYYERIIVDNQLFKFATLKELIDLYHENINAPIFTQNQLLVKMGEQPIEGGDIYITNLNAVAVESLSDLQVSRKDVTSTDETNNQ
mgnify:FL=1